MKKYIKSAEDIFGMARIGMVDQLEVYANTNDAGNIPHFHIRDKVDWEKFHSCIRLDSAKYFMHESKEDILNANQRKGLQKFMTDKVSIARYANKFDNNWELACFLWDLNNSSIEIPEDTTQPDYRDLPQK